MTVPGYPVAGTHTKYYGGEVHRLPLLAENDFLPDLDSIPADIRRRAKLLVLNYPNSPTGKVATREFYARVIDFARRNKIVVVQDAAHVDAHATTGAPLSFLQVPGATRRGRRGPFALQGLEHDRLADGLGLRPRADRAGLCRREGQLRLGPVHRHPEGGGRGAGRSRRFPAARATKYQRRLREAGRHAAPLRLRLPDARRNVLPLHAAARKGIAGGPTFATAEAASQYLITEHSICTVPWDDAGPHLRFSVTYEAADERPKTP